MALRLKSFYIVHNEDQIHYEVQQMRSYGVVSYARGSCGQGKGENDSGQRRPEGSPLKSVLI